MKLETEYQRDNFINFLTDSLLPDFEKDIRPINTGSLTCIKKAHYLGVSKTLDLQVFEFVFEGSINKRVALTKDAFSVMRSSAIYSALAVFRTEDSKDWRFSLLSATPEPTEKGKVTLTYSNPKRLSFFLGPNAKVNTPTKLLVNKGRITDFADLKSRFSLEVVNKEFYKEISQAFTKLVNGLLRLPSIQDKQTNLEFAVRLIGRIIFCWFLREKKSDNNLPLMPKKLLSIEAAKENDDYYHNILEPIFFEVLNRPIKSRREEFSKEPFSLVPYLNGGLFSPQEDDFYKRASGDFQSQLRNALVIPDSWLTAFFEILETYNFTIDENTSYDEELSIDPEMLGRIFENLLAEINPETGESARKSTGSYYTPRTIVSYMVDESLLLYLLEQTGIKEEKLRAIISYDLSDDTENPINIEEKEEIIEALEKVKILDPACGSGAFPIGALQKIVFILQQTDPDGQLWFKKQIKNTSPEVKRVIEREFEHKNFDYIRKLGIIRENIYGVDIQAIATEISRLRCFLTLIVDERIQDDIENRGIEPLPNLDFKFVTANSLIGLPKIDKSQQSMFDDYQKINDLKNIRDQYFNASGIEREQLKTEFVTQQKRLIDQLIKEHGFMGVAKAELTQKLTDWEPFTHKSTSWFDAEWMFGIKEGFNIVIANPPYVGEKGHKLMFDVLRKSILGKRFSKGKMDLFYYFFHLGLDNLKKTGLLSFITTNYFPTADGAKNLRKDMYERSNLVELINFNEYKIFESALGQHNMITLLQKNDPLDTFITRQSFVNINSGPNIDELNSILNRTNANATYTSVTRLRLFESDNLYIRFASNESETDNLLIKLRNIGTPLREFATTNEGIHTGLDSISDKDIQRGVKNNYVKGEGVFVLPKGAFNFKHLYPWYKGSDIGHYVANMDTDLEVLYYDNDTIPEEDEIKHLSKFRDILNNRVAIKRADRPWYQLNWPRKQSMFESKKIVNPYRSHKNYFALVEGPWYASADVFFTQTKDENILSNEALTALLNSKLILFWLNHRGKRKGSILEIKSIPIGQIPIVLPNDGQKHILHSLVQKIISTKSKDRNADTTSLESEINQLIYISYKLTDKEIDIVENSTQ